MNADGPTSHRSQVLCIQLQQTRFCTCFGAQDEDLEGDSDIGESSCSCTIIQHSNIETVSVPVPTSKTFSFPFHWPRPPVIGHVEGKVGALLMRNVPGNQSGISVAKIQKWRSRKEEKGRERHTPRIDTEGESDRAIPTKSTTTSFPPSHTTTIRTSRPSSKTAVAGTACRTTRSTRLRKTSSRTFASSTGWGASDAPYRRAFFHIPRLPGKHKGKMQAPGQPRRLSLQSCPNSGREYLVKSKTESFVLEHAKHSAVDIHCTVCFSTKRWLH
jgi:hypothetical protein